MQTVAHFRSTTSRPTPRPRFACVLRERSRQSAGLARSGKPFGRTSALARFTDSPRSRRSLPRGVRYKRTLDHHGELLGCLCFHTWPIRDEAEADAATDDAREPGQRPSFVERLGRFRSEGSARSSGTASPLSCRRRIMRRVSEAMSVAVRRRKASSAPSSTRSIRCDRTTKTRWTASSTSDAGTPLRRRTRQTVLACASTHTCTRASLVVARCMLAGRAQTTSKAQMECGARRTERTTADEDVPLFQAK